MDDTPTGHNPLSTPVSRVVRCLAAGLLPLLVAQCKTIPDEEVEKIAFEQVTRHREKNQNQWQNDTIGDESILDYAKNRSFILVSGNVDIRIDSVEVTDTSAKASIAFRGSKFTVGTATAIASDGYFLTAAHSVDDQPLQVIVFNDKADKGEVEVAKARVVWNGRHDQPDAPDFALLHASVKPYRHFSLPTWQPIVSGARIYVSGFANGTGPSHAAGTILERGSPETSPDGARWIKIIHDSTFIHGESGGPIFDAEGQLLGINSSLDAQAGWFLGKLRLSGYSSTSFSPDPDWLHRLIVEDRRKRNSRRAAL